MPQTWDCGNVEIAVPLHSINIFKCSKDMKKVMRLFFAVAVLTGLTSCNSNDDYGTQAIEIPGITLSLIHI